MKKIILSFGVIAIYFCVNPSAALADDPHAFAVMQVLDKVTTQRQAIPVPVGKSITIGTLHITARACYSSDPAEKPEQSAFVEIYDAKGGSAKTPIFTGWMFKSSPSVSALEHPIYDVVVLGCSNSADNKS